MGAHKANHDYHLVNPSPWPFIASVSAFIMSIGAIAFMRVGGGNAQDFKIFGADLAFDWGTGVPVLFILGLLGLLYTMFGWWADVIKESKAGDHTPVVQLHHRYGMIFFIASEVMFFVAWFWAFFDAALFFDEAKQTARVAALGGTWPPTGIEIFDPWHLPLFNTLLLLLSGTTVTWAHHALLHDDRKGVIQGLLLSVALGVVFTFVQTIEYLEATFKFGGEGANIYGATFFMATGFHGFHVLVGTIFLAVCLLRALSGHFTSKKHLGFEFAAWYWHFVDVVWLFLFVFIYVWGGVGGVIHHS